MLRLTSRYGPFASDLPSKYGERKENCNALFAHPEAAGGHVDRAHAPMVKNRRAFRVNYGHSKPFRPRGCRFLLPFGVGRVRALRSGVAVARGHERCLLTTRTCSPAATR